MSQIHPRGLPILAATLLLFLPGVAACAERAPDLDPSSTRLAAAALKDFEASWTEMLQRDGKWQEHSRVDEVLTRETVDGRKLVKRVQRADYGAWGVTNTTWLDAADLRPVLYERRVDEVPEAVAEQLHRAGVLRSFRLRLDDRRYELTRVPFEGEESHDDGVFERALYEGSSLGLVLASLPLEASFEVRIPILFASPNDGALQPYWVVARVAAEESLPVGGAEPVASWRVDTDWADFETGEVQSPGGPDQSGGSYWIAKEPTGAVPPVVSYANSGVRFDLLAPAATAEGAAVPEWFLEHVRTMTEGSGRWNASNDECRSENEPYMRVGHESRVEGARLEASSFDVAADGLWKPRRSYVWHRES